MKKATGGGYIHSCLVVQVALLITTADLEFIQGCLHIEETVMCKLALRLFL